MVKDQWQELSGVPRRLVRGHAELTRDLAYSLWLERVLHLTGAYTLVFTAPSHD